MNLLKKLKNFLIIPAIALGIFIFIIQSNARKSPVQSNIKERYYNVRIIPVTEVSIVPRVLGYGIVEPGQVWEAVAEVGGKIVKIHPELKKGGVLLKDEVLVEIDQKDYIIVKERAEAEVKNILSKIREIDQREKNARSLLEAEEKSLESSERELTRKRKLLKEGGMSKSEVDMEEKRYLSQTNAVQNFKNTLNLIPTERESILATLASNRTRLEEALLNIEKTTIKAPFDCIISEANVEIAQVLRVGDVVAVGENIAYSEISANVPIYAMRNLIDTLSIQKEINKVGKGISMEELRKAFGIDAVVRLVLPDNKRLEWKGRFTRISEKVDPKTRTIGVYVAIEDGSFKSQSGGKPPLMKNMYCEVELRGRALEKRFVIPRSALHEGVVYIANSKDRLERRNVSIDFCQEDMAAIKEGITNGERLIVTDVIPAIEGMLLKVTVDDTLLNSLIEEATGKGSEK